MITYRWRHDVRYWVGLCLTASILALAGRSGLGMAQTQELRGYIKDFSASGKDVTAFAESFGEAGNGTLNYYLASAADKIWLQPSGGLDVTGFLLEQPYLRDALDRVGVDPGEFLGLAGRVAISASGNSKSKSDSFTGRTLAC